MKKQMKFWALLLLIPIAAGCRVFEVEDDLYDIKKEQSRVWLQFFYTQYSEDRANDLPSLYLIDIVSETEYPNIPIVFTSSTDGAQITDSVHRSLDELYFSGYLQPGYHRFMSYNEAKGFEIDSLAAVVKANGNSIERNPGPLYLGSLQKQTFAGEPISEGIYVRQRTRQFVFRFLLDLPDSLSYISSDVTLSNVYYRIDMLTDAIDPECQVTLPLHLSKGSYSEDGKTYLSLEDRINVLSPSAYEYNQMGTSNTLTVNIRYAAPSGNKTKTFTFDKALDAAYSQEYAVAENDLNCLKLYTWQTTLNLN